MYYDGSLGEPEFSFGDGLSYDTWALDWHDGVPAAAAAGMGFRSQVSLDLFHASCALLSCYW